MSATKIICQNRKAKFNYQILDKYEGGLILLGSEVKALREGLGNLADTYAVFKKGELWLVNAYIGPYAAASIFGHEERRDRKVLMHQRELERLVGKLKEKGLALVPLSLYFKNGRVKVELGLGKGKKVFDKRDTIKKRESDRQLRRVAKINTRA